MELSVVPSEAALLCMARYLGIRNAGSGSKAQVEVDKTKSLCAKVELTDMYTVLEHYKSFGHVYISYGIQGPCPLLDLPPPSAGYMQL